MRIVRTFLFSLAVIVNCIEFSTQSGGNPQNELNPGFSSHDEERNLPDRSSSQESRFRARSSSPASLPPSIRILGYSLKELGYLRLIPRTNESLRFEFRSYFFPADGRINWRYDGKRYKPVSSQEYIVLSTSNDDILAILMNSRIFRGMYRGDKYHSRIKINMISDAIIDMTTDEMRDCLVGESHPIFPNTFMRAFGNYDSLHCEHISSNKHNLGSSSARQHPLDHTLIRARSVSPPGMPPSDGVLGCTIEQLGFVRLISRTNQNQRFEFRRYIFPTDESIRVRIDGKAYAVKPTREYIVISESNGDVFAILDNGGILRGIYVTDSLRTRVKINMMSSAVENLTIDEVKSCPVGRIHPIFPTSFIKASDNDNTLQLERNPDVGFNSGPSARPKSPPGRPPAHEVLGYPLEKLGYIRLIPKRNPKRQFEFRKYVIPANMPIRFQSGNKYSPVPNQEHIVLSTSNGDVFAILECTGTLRGLYTTNRNHGRMKINMINGAIDKMTAIEMADCHVGEKHPLFPRLFNELVSYEDSLQYVYY